MTFRPRDPNDVTLISEILSRRSVRSRDLVDELNLRHVLECRHGVLVGRGLNEIDKRIVLSCEADDWRDARLEREALIGRWGDRSHASATGRGE